MDDETDSPHRAECPDITAAGGEIEKHRHGFQGPWCYRLKTPSALRCPHCGGTLDREPVAAHPTPATAPPEPVAAVPEQPKAALRYVGRKPFHVDWLYHTGVIWHGCGDVQPIADSALCVNATVKLAAARSLSDLAHGIG